MQAHWRMVYGIGCIIIGILLVIIFPINGNGFNAIPASLCFAIGILGIVSDYINTKSKDGEK